MPDSGKFTDRAAELAEQAAAAAAPLREKAQELAGQAAAAAGPLAAQARERAAALAEQAAAAAGPLAAQARERAAALAEQAGAAAGPLAEQARTRAAHGLDALADNLDRLTGGKYHEQIQSVATKVEHTLDRPHGGAPAAAPDPSLRVETPPLKADTAPLGQDTPGEDHGADGTSS